MIILKRTTPADLESIVQMERDGENNPFIMPYDLEKHSLILSDEDKMHLIILNEAGKQVGFVLLAGFKNEDDNIELRRIVIADKGKGYGSQTITALKKKCFEKHDCNRLWLDVFDFNDRARHVYKKLGFKEEGILRESVKKGGNYLNLVIMSILKKEYESE